MKKEELVPMCRECWNEAGRPEIVNEATLAAARLAIENEDSSALHIVVSDWNLGDHQIEECRENANLTVIEDAFCCSLLNLSLPERFSAMAIAEGYVGTLLKA